MRRLSLLLLALLVAAPATAFADAASDYKTYCSTCHGDTGGGDGPAGAALEPKAASFKDAEFFKTRDDATLAKAIKEGGPAVGKSAMMAPWGSVLDDAKIKDMVTYIKAFAKK